jgi:hypothetical protein
MKKFLIVVLAAFICLAFTLPAMAKVTVGGRITLDWTYLDQDAQQAAGGVALGSSTTSNGFKDMRFIVPWTLNRLNVKYASDDGALSGFIEWRGGGPNDASSGDGFLNYSYLTWQITPSNQITFGKQTTNFARFIPQQCSRALFPNSGWAPMWAPSSVSVSVMCIMVPPGRASRATGG